MRDPDEELAFLSALDECLSRNNTIVSFNGKSFDIPILNTRFRINNRVSPFHGLEHLDMLALSRKLWRNRLSSRALGDLEREILEFKRSEQEIPGWLVPQYYYDYLSTRDARPLAGVFYHNEMDILSLAALFEHTVDLLSNPLLNAGNEIDVVSIGQLYEDLKDYDKSIELYEAALNFGLPEALFLNLLKRYAGIYKQQQLFLKAVPLWEKAAEIYNDIEACIELAKYMEHYQKSYQLAMTWTNNAMQNLERHPLPLYQYKKYHDLLTHRQRRLFNKMNREE
jgi:tetratricopeptide (TPR) repeat protein